VTAPLAPALDLVAELFAHVTPAGVEPPSVEKDARQAYCHAANCPHIFATRCG
jgi:hypothetical protein